MAYYSAIKKRKKERKTDATMNVNLANSQIVWFPFCERTAEANPWTESRLVVLGAGST